MIRNIPRRIIFNLYTPIRKVITFDERPADISQSPRPWESGYKTRSGKHVHCDKRMKKTVNEVYIYIGWDIAHCRGKSATCWRNMVEDDRLLLGEVNLLGNVQYEAT